VASGITGTAFSDAGPLTQDTIYFYAVRAVDTSNGRDDGNTQRRSAFPTGPLIEAKTLTDTFEGQESGGGFDLDGWSHAALTGAQDWVWSTANAQSPVHSWAVPQHGSIADQVLVSPLFVPRPGTAVSFWHKYSFEYGFDGGTLEISTDHGATWNVVPDAAFTAGGFTATLYQDTGNPIAGKRAWTGAGSSAMSQVKVDLSAWAGSEVRLRWHAGEDYNEWEAGWFVDSVTFSNAGFSGGCVSATAAPLEFYTLTPCRLIDTRATAGPLGGPVLQPGALRTFTPAGSCGVPATAKALSVNITVTQPAAPGFLTLYPGGQLQPQTSSINFSPAQTRANNAVLLLAPSGALGVHHSVPGAGPVHLLLDVNGYFQ
jgi:hypothetical protein